MLSLNLENLNPKFLNTSIVVAQRLLEVLVDFKNNKFVKFLKSYGNFCFFFVARLTSLYFSF